MAMFQNLLPVLKIYNIHNVNCRFAVLTVNFRSCITVYINLSIIVNNILILFCIYFVYITYNTAYITLYSLYTIMEDLYSIVEFEDGLQIIPISWLTENKTVAYWPQFTSHSRFTKAVQQCLSHDDTWLLYNIKRILGTASK